MLEVGDKVWYIGKCKSIWQKRVYKRTGTIVEICKNRIRIRYKKKYNNVTYWFNKNNLKKVIPEYILGWEKRLDEI